MGTGKVRSLLIPFLVLLSLSCSGKANRDQVLFDFESDASLNRLSWKCFTTFSLSHEHVTHGENSLKIDFYPSDYPQLLTKTKRKDWSGYRFFSFDIFNPGLSEVRIFVRIDDRKEFPDYGDRYSKSFSIHTGSNRITIPLAGLETSATGRKLDLEKIYRFFIFQERPKKKTVIYLDHIRLVAEN